MKKGIVDFIKKSIKKRIKASEFYKTETPEHIFALIESSRKCVYLLFILYIIYNELQIAPHKINTFFISFLFGFLFFQISYAILKGWNLLNKLHKIIKEENYEIQHHRAQEKKELESIYKAKGFSGELLQKVVNVIMADDNRLLKVMMEEEMGLVLRRYEHPLKQGLFAGIGVIISGTLLFLPILSKRPSFEFFLLGSIIITVSSITKKNKKNLSYVIVWNLSTLALTGFITYFFTKLLTNL